MSEERKTIYLCLAHMSDEGYQQKYAKEASDTNSALPMAPNVHAFEKDLEAFVNCRPQSSFPSAPSLQERAGGEAKVVCL